MAVYVKIPQLLIATNADTMQVLYSKKDKFKIKERYLKEVFGTNSKTISEMDIRTNEILLRKTITGERLSTCEEIVDDNMYGWDIREKDIELGIRYISRDLILNNIIKFETNLYGSENIYFDITRLQIMTDNTYKIIERV